MLNKLTDSYWIGFIQLTTQIAEKQKGGHCTKTMLTQKKWNVGSDTNMDSWLSVTQTRFHEHRQNNIN